MASVFVNNAVNSCSICRTRRERRQRLISSSPADLRTGLRTFLTHFTSAGHTTEVMTARAVADLVACLAEAEVR